MPLWWRGLALLGRARVELFVDMVDATGRSLSANAAVDRCCPSRCRWGCRLCFNCVEPGHVAGMCTGKRRCLNCKSEEHIARQSRWSAPWHMRPRLLRRVRCRHHLHLGRHLLHLVGRMDGLFRRLALLLHLRGTGRQGRPHLHRFPTGCRRASTWGSWTRRRCPFHPHVHPSRNTWACVASTVWMPEVARPRSSAACAVRGSFVRRHLCDTTRWKRAFPCTAGGLRHEQELHAAALASMEARPVETPRRSDAEVVADIDAARPASERCIIYRTPEVDEAERALRWGMVVFVSSTRSFWPADLLLVFDSRANRDVLLDASPLDGRDFTLWLGVWNRQLQTTRRTFRYRVHLEVVGVPLVAWSMCTAKTILGSSAWVERLGSEMVSRVDIGSFRITAWTDDPTAIPKTKRLWLAKPLLFGEEDDDLLLPVEALVPEEVALLDYDTTVHLVRVEDTASSRGRSFPGGEAGDDASGDDGGGRGGRGGDAPDAGSGRPHSTVSGRPAPDRVAPPRRWRGGTERRVALGQTTSVRPWPSIRDDAPASGGCGRGPIPALRSVVVGRLMSDHLQAPQDGDGVDLDKGSGQLAGACSEPA
ncbi:hypothetical protein ACQ4PT_070049 [Festuca glaucescens]